MPRAQQVGGRKAAKRSNAAARQKRMFNLMRKREPLISLAVLRKLAASNLPADPAAYNVRLQQLLAST